ncbi:hypothetical protein E2562_004965 [Oryza meyeriana var. granulata]|uniref:SKP1 component POZ domain-containing protein n=1 Tax=Oryza meyeriana var. granulata TaxID=110450 RepID=A0A6G1C496_9ORYZ|nr:hypothetical protein E2562_004965 [Oryza meyeriana var. granulata]
MAAVTEGTGGDGETRNKMIHLENNDDNEQFEDLGPDITSAILARVVDYCGRHAAAATAMDNDGLNRSNHDFLSGVDQDTLFDLLLATTPTAGAPPSRSLSVSPCA